MFNDREEFYGRLREEYERVAKASLDSEEEGEVLYVVSRRGKKAKVVSLCKLKTNEYKLFRKIREKLRVYSGNKNLGDIQKRFKKEAA